ncbi:hypothetical protein AB0N05_31945 [Nocardia sp. NPDC051030]|uniref:hypothetical protein n=1 Tax=Nocardia sp. NPDC051030 TaxID=3155162 RepID=UPI00341D9520
MTRKRPRTDKTAAMRVAADAPPSDRERADTCALLTHLGARHGLHLAAAGSFVGHGQARAGGTDPRYPILGFRRG